MANVGRTRNLTDSEARWEAVQLIAAAVDGALMEGAVTSYGDEHGWTEADQLAIEQHALARVDGLIRRPRKRVGYMATCLRHHRHPTRADADYCNRVGHEASRRLEFAPAGPPTPADEPHSDSTGERHQ